MKTSKNIRIAACFCLLAVIAVSVFLLSGTPSKMDTLICMSAIRLRYPDLCTGAALKGSIPAGILFFDSDRASFGVNPETKRIQWLYMKDTDETYVAPIELVEAREIAKSVLQKYRPDIDLSRMTETEGGLVYSIGYMMKYYRFIWRVDSENADTDGIVRVELRPGGELLSCLVCGSVETNGFKDDPDHAMKMIYEFLWYSTPMMNDQYSTIMEERIELISWDQEHSYWLIYLLSVNPQLTYDHHFFIIDNQTSEIITYYTTNCEELTPTQTEKLTEEEVIEKAKEYLLYNITNSRDITLDDICITKSNPVSWYVYLSIFRGRKYSVIVDAMTGEIIKCDPYVENSE